MYELIILILLARRPMHGYLIAKILNDIIGPYARISNGRLYPLLARLEENGLIEAYEEPDNVKRGTHHLRSYRLTEDGRQRFHILMMDTTSNPGEYQRIFRQKVAAFNFLQPSERLHLLDHYINYCQAHVLHLTSEAEDLADHKEGYFQGGKLTLTATLDVMNHMADQWRLELAWVQRLRQEEVARQMVNNSAQNEHS